MAWEQWEQWVGAVGATVRRAVRCGGQRSEYAHQQEEEGGKIGGGRKI